MTALCIRAFEPADWPEWLRMSRELFPGASVADDEAEMREFRARADAEVFVLARPNGLLAGYVEVSTRPYADGCGTSPVGYIEAWFVDADVRRLGHGRQLLAAAEDWARQRGYREIASDALLDNEISLQAHRRSGYAEVDRVVQFRKALTSYRSAPLRAVAPAECQPGRSP